MRTWTIIKTSVILIVFCLCLPSPGFGARRKRQHLKSVAILKLNSMGVDGSVAKNFRKAIVKTLKRSRRWRYVPTRHILKRIGKAGVSRSASVDVLAKASGVRFLLVGTLAGIGKNISLDMKVISGKNGKTLRRISVVLPQDTVGLNRVLDESLTKLLSPAKWTGSLALAVSEDNAKVFIDGVQVATTPLEKPLNGIIPGKHIISIRKEGFSDFSQFVVIKYRQVARLEVDLSSATLVGLIYEKKEKKKPEPLVAKIAKKPAPELSTSHPVAWQKVTGWICLGIGTASLLSSGLLAWHADELETDIARGWWSEGNEGVLQAKLSTGRRINNWSNYTLVAGGSFVLISAGFLLWGYLAEPDEKTHLDQSADSTSVVPMSLPFGAGLALVGRF